MNNKANIAAIVFILFFILGFIYLIMSFTNFHVEKAICIEHGYKGVADGFFNFDNTKIVCIQEVKLCITDNGYDECYKQNEVIQ